MQKFIDESGGDGLFNKEPEEARRYLERLAENDRARDLSVFL